MAVAILFASFAWAQTIANFPQHSSVFSNILTSLAQLEDPLGQQYQSLSKADKISNYQALTKFKNQNFNTINSRYLGREKGSNVILFVMETAPRRAFDLNGGIETLPNLKQLAKNAFVGLEHYSTYPYTSNAIFSIISSIYPSARKNVIQTFGQGNYHTGLFIKLKQAGYFTASYSPYKAAFEQDEKMFQALGIDTQYIAQDSEPFSQQVIQHVKAELVQLKADNPQFMEKKLLYDIAALHRMEHDIVELNKKNKKFAMMYLPQIGHGPWEDLKHQDSIPARGRAIIELQDKWLGSLLELLKNKMLLQNTIIVITGDHGIRTKKEDPDFKPGFINKYSFNVPLYIYAPNTLVQSSPYVNIPVACKI
jgi:phosphoglycerol transferase MdoB-like AlkP superfamily enzyme